MRLRRIETPDKRNYMALLLLADEQPSMIDRYIDRGEMFALVESEVRAVCVVTKERPGIYEVKNMATVPAYQRQGYGRRLLAMILEYYQKNTEAHTLLVGTGDSPATIGFYEACGFVRSHVVKNFFTDYYDHPIMENGQQLVDMIYLRKKL